MTEFTADNLAKLKRGALEGLEAVVTLKQLETWRVAYIGRKGALSSLLRQVKGLSLKDRKLIGSAGNEVKQELEERYEMKQAGMAGSDPPPVSGRTSRGGKSEGHLHPLTLAARRLQKIFSGMGWLMVEGPLAEEARYNFDLLNIPLDHPARAEIDTFYLKGGQVLRTHTSPVQLRAVLEQNLIPPFKIWSPGRVFRAERTDATHETTFSQFEGLMVGRQVSITDFKGVVKNIYQEFFERQVKLRLRPSFFPFVEPGFEIDISCMFCKGKGCRICRQAGWIEVMGAGMVHPNVLENMNLDATKYQGFAFGGGIDRLAMLRHGINDVRLFRSGDLKFLRQFS